MSQRSYFWGSRASLRGTRHGVYSHESEGKTWFEVYLNGRQVENALFLDKTEADAFFKKILRGGK